MHLETGGGNQGRRFGFKPVGSKTALMPPHVRTKWHEEFSGPSATRTLIQTLLWDIHLMKQYVCYEDGFYGVYCNYIKNCYVPEFVTRKPERPPHPRRPRGPSETIRRAHTPVARRRPALESRRKLVKVNTGFLESWDHVKVFFFLQFFSLRVCITLYLERIKQTKINKQAVAMVRE